MKCWISLPRGRSTFLRVLVLLGVLGVGCTSQENNAPQLPTGSAPGSGGNTSSSGGQPSGGEGGSGGAIGPDGAVDSGLQGGSGGAFNSGAQGGSGGAVDSGVQGGSGGTPITDDAGVMGGMTAAGGTTLTELPQQLSDTGLYQDIAADLIAEEVEPFTPQFALWTDTATKRRWVQIPKGEQVDSTDMDNWTFPVGTKLWKEFSRDGKRIETRLLMRVRTGGRGWKGVAYAWNEDQTDAVAVPEGLENARGTAHDIPAEGDCRTCHGERPDWPLGFSAVLLAHDGEGVTTDSLVADGRLSSAPAAPIVVPGTPTERALIGYLHTNCGHCHRFGAAGSERSKLMLWLNVDQLGSIEQTDAYSMMVNVSADAADSELGWRVFGGAPEKSELYRRFSFRGDVIAMPPLGTEEPDTAMLALMEEWINSLSPPPLDGTGGAPQ